MSGLKLSIALEEGPKLSQLGASSVEEKRNVTVVL